VALVKVNNSMSKINTKNSWNADGSSGQEIARKINKWTSAQVARACIRSKTAGRLGDHQPLRDRRNVTQPDGIKLS
jgi:hypothetical protein